MKSCEDYRGLFSEALEGGSEVKATLQAHLERCEDCRRLFDEFSSLFSGPALLDGLPAPEQMSVELVASPCTRWLRRLFSAIDRELPEEELGELFEHLESCPDCRRAWGDLSLIHQLSDAIQAPESLVQLCLRHEAPRRFRQVLGRKTASAAAYFLAVLASLVIGNPVSFARYSQATATVQQLRSVVSPEVSEVARSGRGELRLMLWRSLRFGQKAMNNIELAWNEMVGNTNPEAAVNKKEGSS